MGLEPRNRAERRAALRKARRVAGSALAASGAAFGTTAAVLNITAGPAGAATVTVDTLADGDDGECIVDCTLREAIDTAASGDTIDFGVTGPITLLGAYGGQLVINKDLTISGPGAANLTVSGDDNYRVFYIYDAATALNVSISGITIADGFAGEGGGIILWGESLTLTSSVVTGNNVSNEGGGLWISGAAGGVGDATISTTTFYDNYAGNSGGAISVSTGVLTVQAGTAITNNEAVDDGGGIEIEDTSAINSITGATITGNVADDGGGVFLYDPDHDIVITNTTISGNTAYDSGGGIYLYDTDSAALTIVGSTIHDNHALNDVGGGIYLYNPDGDISITNTTISSNDAAGSGGGIYFYEQSAGEMLTIADSRIIDNESGGSGGGVYFYDMYGAGFEITNTTISGNSADGDGGGFFLYDTDDDPVGVFRNTTISNNTAGGSGGGMMFRGIDSVISMFNSTVSGNTAAEGGASAFGEGTDGFELVQTTVTDNHVSGGAVGGLYFDYFGPNSIAGGTDHATLKANKAAARAARDAESGAEDPAPPSNRAAKPDDSDAKSPNKGAGDAANPQLAPGDVSDDEIGLIGAIVSGNDGLDIGGGNAMYGADHVLSDHSIIGTIAAHGVITDLGGTIRTTNPGLGPLANNGGPTQTHEVLGASVAIDAGPIPLSTFTGNQFDQRGPGFARVINGRVDIGAYEASGRVDFTG